MIPVLHRFATLGSTMDEARALAVAGAAEGTMVQADVQTAARGRLGNKWQSYEGNLFLTTILRPRVNTQDVAQASFVVAVALAEAIGRDDLKLKWPNDILASGRKIAGILLEMEGGAKPDFLLVGTGVNVVAGPEGSAYIHETQAKDSAEALRERYFARLDDWYARWLREGFSPVRAAWMARAHGLGQGMSARLAQRRLEGVFHGIDARGQLLLRGTDGATHAISSGEVYFAPAPGIA